MLKARDDRFRFIKTLKGYMSLRVKYYFDVSKYRKFWFFSCFLKYLFKINFFILLYIMYFCLFVSFQSILKVRQFHGTINIQHENRLITINVIPHDNGEVNAVSNTKSLSGGERSFTTVAFLISLWSCVDHPFYFLDEYDVFTVSYFILLSF